MVKLPEPLLPYYILLLPCKEGYMCSDRLRA
jgi:hypothetical protein